MRPDNEEGRPGREAASRVDSNGLDTTSVRHAAARPPSIRARRSSTAALRTLRPADRARVLDRLAELRNLERIARERGTLAEAVRS